jgi:mRNA-degrading endonuclease RelE of RelBE toxin-antitoxin system
MQDKKLAVEVAESNRFKKDVKNLIKRYRSIRQDIEPLIKQLEAGETPGNRITGNKYPVYKARVNNSNTKKGQSGGYRVVCYIMTSEAILLTKIYSKLEQDNISNQEIEDIIEQHEIEFNRQREESIAIDKENSEDT